MKIDKLSNTEKKSTTVRMFTPLKALKAEKSVISLHRILNLTKARMIYAMISVTSVVSILYVILQRRDTILKQR